MQKDNTTTVIQADEPDGSKSKNRRDSARKILAWLLIAIAGLSILLVGAAPLVQNLPGQLSGIVMTALAGAISSLLSFAGLIIKGLVANLSEPTPHP